MSATANKHLLQDILAKAAAGDRQPYVDALAEDVQIHVTGQYSWSQTFRGKASVLRDLYGYLETLVQPGRKTIPHRLIADEDFVVVQGKGQMTTKGGVPYNNDYCLVYRIKDGKIAEMWEYCDSVLTEKVLGPFPARTGA
jgi:ketosteroid isomerase-like protein